MALLTRIKDWVDGEVLGEADLDAEFNNIINNYTPLKFNDYSANDVQMQVQADPYPAASTSRATDLGGELARLRYQLSLITGETYWYIDPDGSLASLFTTGATVVHAAGLVGTPSITTVGDLDTGDFFPAANSIARVTGGSEAYRTDSSQRTIFGHTASVNFSGVQGQIQSHATTGALASIQIGYWADNSNAAQLLMGKSRGALGTPGTPVVTGDDIGRINWVGDDGTDLDSVVAQILVVCSDTIDIDQIPGNLQILTANTSGILTTAIEIDSSQNVILAGELAITGIMSASTWPSMSVHRNGVSQDNIIGIDKIEWTTKEFDTNNDFDSDTNYRWVPAVAGKYLLSATIEWTGASTDDYLHLHIYKNNSSIKTSSWISQGGNPAGSQTVIAVVDANGTDYFEIFAENTVRDTSDITGTAIDTYFTGCRIG